MMNSSLRHETYSKSEWTYVSGRAMTLSISPNGAASRMLDELLRAERRPMMSLAMPRGLLPSFLLLLSSVLQFLRAASGLSSVLLGDCCCRDL